MKKFVFLALFLVIAFIGVGNNIYDYVPGGTEFVLSVDNVDPLLEAVEGFSTDAGESAIDENLQNVLNTAQGAQILLFGNTSLALSSGLLNSDFDFKDEKAIIPFILTQDLVLINNVFDSEFIDNFVQSTFKPFIENMGTFEREEINMQDYPIFIYRITVNGTTENLYLMQDDDYAILSTDEHLLRKSMDAKEFEDRRLKTNYPFFKNIIEKDGLITFMNRGFQINGIFLKAADIIYGFPAAESFVISVDKDMNFYFDFLADLEYDTDVDRIYTINSARDTDTYGNLPVPEGFNLLISTGKINFSPENISDLLENFDPLDDVLDAAKSIESLDILSEIIPVFLKIANYPEIWLDTTGEKGLEIFFKTDDVSEAIELLSEELGSEIELNDGLYFMSDGNAYIMGRDSGDWIEIGAPVPDKKPLYENSPKLSEVYPAFFEKLEESYASISSLIFAEEYGEGAIGFNGEGDFKINLHLNLKKFIEMYLTLADNFSTTDYNNLNVSGNEEILNMVIDGELESFKNKVNEGFDPESIIDDWNTETALHVAVVYEQFEIVKYLLEELHVYPDPLNYYNQTPLYLAVLYGNYDFSELLLENGADPNVENDYGETPLYIAISYGYDDIAELLKEYGAEEVEIPETEKVFNMVMNGELESFRNKINEGFDPETVIDDWNTETALHVAAVYDQLEIAKYLLEELDVNPDALNYYGQTPLILAASYGDYDLCELLLKNDADPNIEDDFGESALYNATMYGYDEVAELLKKYGAEEVDINVTEGNDEIYNIIISGDLEAFKTKIDEGFDPEAIVDSWLDENSLHVAVANSQYDIAEYLLEDLWVNPDPLNIDEQTPLYLAVMSGDYNMVELLLDNWANPNSVDSYGDSVLYIAKIYGFGDIADLLIEYGANDDIDTSDISSVVSSGDFEKFKEAVADKDPNYIIDNWIGDTLLITVARYGTLEMAEYLLDMGADIEITNQDLETPILAASYNGNYEIVEFLLENGANPDVIDLYGYTPLSNAYYADPDMIELLLKNGANPDIEDLNYDRLLFDAIYNEDKELVDLLLYYGADANKANSYGETPIMIAEYYGYNDIARTLMNYGAESQAYMVESFELGDLEFVKKLVEEGKINEKINNRTPVYLATYYYQPELIEYLVENGADLNILSGENDDPPIFNIIDVGDIEILDYLITSGAEVNIYNMNGITPLLLAASYSDKDAYDVLVDYGAEEDVSDYSGNIALSYVVYFGEEGYLDFAKYLIEKGAVSDINKLSDYGEAPLYWALSAANYEGADLLIEYGADIDLKDISGNTLLHTAVENNDLQAVKYLVEKGANFNLENEWGETPLQLSQAYEFTEISEYLKEMGAK